MEYSEAEIKKALSEHFPVVDTNSILIHLDADSQPSCSKKSDYSHLTMDEIVHSMMEKYVPEDFLDHVEKYCEQENMDFDGLLGIIGKKHGLKLEELREKMIQEQSSVQEEENSMFDINTEPRKLWDTLCIMYENAIENKDYYEAATACRLILNQIDFQVNQKQLSLDAATKFKTVSLIRYSRIVDDVSEGGLNNYLKEIQSKQSPFLPNLGVAPVSEPQWDKWKSTLDEISNEELSTYINSDLIKDIDKELTCLPRSEDSDVDEVLQNEVLKLVGDRINAALTNCSPEILDKIFGDDVGSSAKDFESMREDTTSGIERSNPVTIPVFSAPKRRAFADQKRNSCISPTVFNYENQVNTEKQRRSAVKRKQENDDFSNDEPSGSKQPARSVPSFKTAKDVLVSQNNDKSSNNARKSLGSRRSVHSKFITPISQQDDEDADHEKLQHDGKDDNAQDERLKGIDPKMVEVMMNEIMDHDSPITWDNIAGLEFVKTTLKEIVVWPLLRPDLFTGLRGPPKGILLFGPPGTGKTLIGKCVASQSKSTFFSISASSLGSKWYGEGEKLVRALFTVARCYQPAVIFIDEIDSLLTQRSDNDHESSRRVKTEFLVQLDGVKTVGEERLLIIGATNRPQELDEAARRRLVKRLYIPLPEPCARIQIVKTLLANHSHELSEDDLNVLKEKTEGYSGADMTNLCKEAALGPIRSIDLESITSVTSDDVRPIRMVDFIKALSQVRASVSDADLSLYEDWNKRYGSIFS